MDILLCGQVFGFLALQITPEVHVSEDELVVLMASSVVCVNTWYELSGII